MFATILSTKDINECLDETLHDCDGNATCADTDGAYNCTCNIGYTGNGTIGYCLGLSVDNISRYS